MSWPAPPVAELARAIAPGPLLGLRSATSTAQSDQTWHLPAFEDEVFTLSWPEQLDSFPEVPAELVARLEQDPRRTLFVETFLPFEGKQRRRLRQPTERGVLRDSAALIHALLARLPPSTPVVFFASAALATLDTFTPFRAALLDEHTLEWLVLFDAPTQSETLAGLPFLLGCCRAHHTPTKGSRLRLVNLSRLPHNERERELRSARQRDGGEAGHSIVMPLDCLGPDPWVYERFTEAHAQTRRDARALGPLTPLRELVEPPRRGLHPIHDAKLLARLPENAEDGLTAELPEGMLPVIDGRCVRPGQLLLQPRFGVNAVEAPSHARLEPGDLLIREIFRPCPGAVVAIVPRGLEAVLGPTVIRLRLRPEVAPETRELILGWLASKRATSHAFSTMGGHVRITIKELLELDVPTPSESVLKALASLSELERWYAERATAVHAARQDIFSSTTTNYTRAVSVLLETQRHEGERVTASRDSQRFDYRVRNYFPHPLALRYEQLQVLPPGKERLESILECSEYVVHFLALSALAQLTALRPDSLAASKALGNAMQEPQLRLTWGLSRAILQEGISASLKVDDPLKLSIPEFGSALATLLDASQDLAKAEALLRDQRNDEAHLRGASAHECAERSAALHEALETVLHAADFLTETPLVYVRDYRFDGLTGERWATLDWLRGASVVFERREQEVTEELPRGALGLLDHSGSFHNLGPWLMLETCEVCKRPEVFLFNQLERDAVTYVAMESGHLHRTATTLPAFARLAAAGQLSED